MIPPRRKSAIEERLDAFFAALDAIERPSASEIASALSRHLADEQGELPTATASASWQRVRTFMKVRTPGRTLTPEAINALQSWPSARLDELVAALRATHAALQSDSNARWEAEIREQVAKTYL